MSDILTIDGVANVPVLRVLCASAMRSALSICAQNFHADSGAGFEIHWCTSGAVEQRLGAGEVFDLTGGAREALDNLSWRALVQPPFLDVGVSKLALGVRTGEHAPDISSLDKLRDALLAARKISRGDPAGGGTAGKHLVKLFRQMDILDDVMSKSILRAGGFAVMSEVAEGRADFGLTQSTEIPAVEGVTIGAFLPDAAQMQTLYALCAARADAPSLARDFVSYVGAPGQRTLFAAAGFAPA